MVSFYPGVQPLLCRPVDVEIVINHAILHVLICQNHVQKESEKRRYTRRELRVQDKGLVRLDTTLRQLSDDLRQLIDDLSFSISQLPTLCSFSMVSCSSRSGLD